MSETDLFASMGLDDVEADPNHIADGMYNAHVYESQILTAKSGKKAGRPQWVLNYKILEGTYKGRVQSEWFDLGPNNDQAKPWIKRRILSLGVPESKVSEFQPADVIGTPVTVKIQTKDGWQNVVNVDLGHKAVDNGQQPTSGAVDTSQL